jgi:hypothetical protein
MRPIVAISVAAVVTSMGGDRHQPADLRVGDGVARDLRVDDLKLAGEEVRSRACS